jgi:hypothetical protein
MIEPPELASARKHLAHAESAYRTADGLYHLEEGLALLEEVIAGKSPEYRTLALNLAASYSTRIYGAVRKLVESDRGLPEPELEHLFKVVVAFDELSFQLPVESRTTKINLVRDLIDRYYEGHSPEAKRAALEQLAEISKERPRGRRRTSK